MYVDTAFAWIIIVTIPVSLDDTLNIILLLRSPLGATEEAGHTQVGAGRDDDDLGVIGLRCLEISRRQLYPQPEGCVCVCVWRGGELKVEIWGC